MQAIQTKYHGPGNVRGSRITARAAAGTLSVPFDRTLDTEANHRAAAETFVADLGWLEGGRFRLEGGCLHDESWAWVLVLNTIKPTAKCPVCDGYTDAYGYCLSHPIVSCRRRPAEVPA